MSMHKMPLLAYHNDPALRTATLVEMRAHLEADSLVQGYGYWSDGKGCAVGCLTKDPHGGHALYPTRWGIPQILAHLEDRIFEGLPVEAAKTWPMAFLSAIQTGADLSGAWPRFAHALLADPERGVARLAKEGSAQRLAIDAVAALYQRTIDGETVPTETWRKARSSAAVYASSAAYAAVYASAAAADAYASAAAYAAADASARTAARSGHYIWYRDKLLMLLAAAPVGAAS